MASVDDRVVAMKFDNNQFESKVASTVGSLDKLKSSLNFDGQSKSLQNLSKTSSGFSLDGIGTALEHISNKFNVMGAVGFSVIQNLTDRAMQMAERITKSFSLDGAISGFREYETNMNAIQTVLANTRAKGTVLDDVNVALQQLNKYSDQTIYNFSQMAKNVGTFTAAGVDLDTSVASIKGISNLAAISGSSAEQAANAMYQLSQAISSGTLKLIDWNSVVNAGMGGEVFQKALFETGKSLGTIKGANLSTTFEEWTKAGNTFRGSLESGWLTSKVLTTTLQGFTGDLNEAQLIGLGYTQAQAKEFVELGKSGLDAATKVKTLTQLISTIKESVGSGWSQSFTLILGDFEGAKSLFTSLNDLIGGFVSRSAEARNNLLETWAKLGGRGSLIQAVRNSLWAVASVASTVGKAFREVFPKVTAERLAEISGGLERFTKSLIPTQATLEKLGRIAKGVFSIFSIGWTVVEQIAASFFKFFKAFNAANGAGILEYFAKLGDRIFELRKTLVEDGGIAKFFEKHINPIAKLLGSINITENVQKITDNLNKLKESILETFQVDSVSQLIDNLVAKFQVFKDAINGLFNADAIPGVGKIIDSSSLLGDRWERLIKIGEKFATFLSWIGDKIKAAAEVFKEFFGRIIDSLKTGDFDGVKDALNTGLFAALIAVIHQFVKNGFKFDFGQGLLGNISKSFEQLTGTLSAMQAKLKAEALLKIAIALGVLTASVLVLSLIDSNALTKAMTALAAGFTQLVASMAILNKIIADPRAASKLAIVSGAFILLGVAIGALALSVKLLSTMDEDELKKGLLSVAALLGGVTLAMNALPEHRRMIQAGLGIIGISVALNILAGAVKLFSMMSSDEMKQGLLGIGVALIELTAALNLMPKDTVLVGTGLIAVALALNILAGAVFAFGSMNFDTMLQGLLGVAAALIVLIITMRLMPNDLALIGAGLILVGVGLSAVAGAVAILGNMNIESMIQGLAGMAAALVTLGIATSAMTGSLAGSAAILVAAGALVGLAFALKLFAQMELSDLAKGLLGIGLVIGGIALGAAALAPAVPAILSLGGAMLALGLGLAAIGLAAALFGAGVYLIAEAIKTLVGIGVEGIKTFITILPDLTVAVVEAIINVVKALLEGTPDLIRAFGAVLGALLQLIIDYIPKFGEAIGAVITAIVTLINEHAGEIIQAGLGLLLSFLQGISDNIERITFLVADIIIKFTTALAEKVPDLVAAGLKLLTEFLRGISDNIGQVIDEGSTVVQKFLEGMARNVEKVIDAGATLLTNILSGFGRNISRVAHAAGTIITEFIAAIGRESLRIIQAGVDMLIDFINGLADSIQPNRKRLQDAGFHLVQEIVNGMISGFGDLANLAIDAAKKLASGILDGIKDFFGISSPSKVMYSMAGFVAQGFAKGLANDRSASTAASIFANDVVNKINSSMSRVSAMAEGMNDFAPTITPVIDMTNIERGAAKISDLMGDPQFGATVSIDQASSLAKASRSDDTIQVESESSSIEPIEIKFEQNIHSPVALSTAAIFRQTKSQLAFAKEELNV